MRLTILTWFLFSCYVSCDETSTADIPVLDLPTEEATIIGNDEKNVMTGLYDNSRPDKDEVELGKSKAEKMPKEIPKGHMGKLGSQGKILVDEISVLYYMIGGRDFYEHFMHKRRPVLFKGVASDWKAVKHWKNESYLLEKYSDVLFDVEMGKIYQTSQHPRKTMTMREFLSKYRNTTHMYLDSPFPQSNMTGDMEVPLMMQCDKLYTRFKSAHILFSNGGTSSPLHYDGYENFLTLMSGIKVVYVAHFKYAEDLYIDSYHDFPGLSPVNPESVDLIKYPRVSNVPFHKVVLKPGDMLYIPEGWFHQVRSYESPNIAVSMWFHLFEGAYTDINNNTLRLAELAKHVANAPATIECKSQVTNMFSYPEINLQNIGENIEPAKQDFVNRTVLYDQVSSTDAVIYVGSDDHWIYAIDMRSGTVKWKVETKEDTGSTCAFNLDGNVVYCGADDSYMRALHITNGSLVWAYKTGDRVISSAVVDDAGTIYFGSLDYFMYAINPNGTVKWNVSLNGAIWSTPAIDFSAGVIYIAVDNANAEFNIFALKKENGDIIWKKFSGFGFNSSPKLNPVKNELYICDKGGNVFILEKETGSVIYRFDMNDTGGIMSSPAIHSAGILYSLSHSGLLVAYDLKSKQITWQLNLGESERGSNSSPYIARNNMLYVGGGNGTIFSIHPLSGKIQWKTDVGTGIFFSSPRVDKNGVLYIGSIDGPFYALDSNSGKIIWRVKTQGPLVGTALITREYY